MAQPLPQTQAARANTLDRMLNDIDLPDLSNGYFSYSVDDFFVDYVDALGQRGLQSSGSLALSNAPGKKKRGRTFRCCTNAVMGMVHSKIATL